MWPYWLFFGFVNFLIWGWWSIAILPTFFTDRLVCICDTLGLSQAMAGHKSVHSKGKRAFLKRAWEGLFTEVLAGWGSNPGQWNTQKASTNGSCCYPGLKGQRGGRAYQNPATATAGGWLTHSRGACGEHTAVPAKCPASLLTCSNLQPPRMNPTRSQGQAYWMTPSTEVRGQPPGAEQARTGQSLDPERPIENSTYTRLHLCIVPFCSTEGGREQLYCTGEQSCLFLDLISPQVFIPWSLCAALDQVKV